MVGVAILCFCLACILSITTSVDMASSVKLLKKLIQFVIFFWVANSVQEEKQRSLLVVLVIVSGAAAALGGLTQLLLDGSRDQGYTEQRIHLFRGINDGRLDGLGTMFVS